MIRLDAPAKINLHLGVGDVRPDGFHEVVTVLQTLELADVVELAPAASLSLVCDPDPCVSADRNLAYRAARALAAALDRDPDVAIRVRKAVPAGAGLGGGSSDAAAVLRGLARLWDLREDSPEALDVARGLGADVPFFLCGGTALMAGRGDELVRHLDAPAMDVVVVWPGEPVPTADAYAAFDAARSPASPGPEALLEALQGGDVRLVAERLHNDMTGASTTLVPAIAEALAVLRTARGVLGAEMCGSGSAVFGICETTGAALEATAAAQARGWWASATRTTGSMRTAGSGRGVGAGEEAADG